MKFRLVRQPEMAYITESGRAYGEQEPPRMAWAAPSGYLFRGGWEEINMGLGNEAIAAKISANLVPMR
jgi:hypothetical protein